MHGTSGSSSPHARTCSRPFGERPKPQGWEAVAAGSRLHSWAGPRWQELWALGLIFLTLALPLTFLSAWDRVQLFSSHSKPAPPPSSGPELILLCPSQDLDDQEARGHAAHLPRPLHRTGLVQVRQAPCSAAERPWALVTRGGFESHHGSPDCSGSCCLSEP